MQKAILLLLTLLFAQTNLANVNVDSLLLVGQSNSTEHDTRLEAYKNIINYYLLKSLDTALHYSQEYQDLAAKMDDEKGVSMGLFYKAKSHAKHNNLKEAILLYSESYNLAKTLNDPDLTTYVMLNLGVLESNIGNHDQAISILSECKSIAYSNNNYEYIIKSLNSIGNIYLSLSDYSKAQVAFLEALKVNKTYDDTYLNAVLSVGIGNTYLVLSAYEDAIRYYYEGIKYAEKDGNFFIKMVALTNINSSFIALKEYEKAIENTTISINYFKENNETRFVAQAMQMRAQAYADKGESDRAMTDYKNSLKLFDEVQSNENIMFSYNAIGSLYLEKNDVLKAEETLLRAKKIGEQYSYNTNLSNTYGLLGKLYLLSNKRLGLEYYEKSLDLADSFQINESKINVYHKLYQYNKGEENYKLALAYYENYRSLNDSLKGEDSKLKIEEIETRYEVDKKDQEIALLEKDQELAEFKFHQEQEKNRLQILLVVLVFGILVLIIGIVVLRLKARQKSKIQQLETRGLKVETQMLRSQMNPHFIFNSLNSIQSFITDNHSIDAERYMSKFAKLMRLILDNSRKSFILLENEVATLNHYLELEQLRFDNRFSYYIEVKNMEVEFTQVPPMLIQPYVENAILHGVGGIDNGHVSIVYKQVNNKVICTIDDNGIGRKNSNELKTESQLKRTSLGIKVTEERIALLRVDFKTNFKIEIIDKYDALQNAIGTTVIVEMPMVEKQ